MEESGSKPEIFHFPLHTFLIRNSSVRNLYSQFLLNNNRNKISYCFIAIDDKRKIIVKIHQVCLLNQEFQLDVESLI